MVLSSRQPAVYFLQCQPVLHAETMMSPCTANAFTVMMHPIIKHSSTSPPLLNSNVIESGRSLLGAYAKATCSIAIVEILRMAAAWSCLTLFDNPVTEQTCSA